MTCAVGPGGQIAVLAIGRTTPELYTLDLDGGRRDEIDLPEADRLALTNVQRLPNLGWLLTGSQGGENDQEAVAYLSTNLTSWTTIGVASHGNTTSVSTQPSAPGSTTYSAPSTGKWPSGPAACRPPCRRKRTDRAPVPEPWRGKAGE